MSSMLKPPRTAHDPRQRSESAEEAVTTAYVRSRNFVDENRTGLIVAAVGIAVVFLGVLWFFYQGRVAVGEAEEALGAILPTYEAGNYAAALDGTGAADGLLEIADEYDGTPSGAIAAFYAGNALFELERYEEAAEYFEEVEADGILAASALAGRAAVEEKEGDFEDAGELYEEAARIYPSAATAPDYFLDAARAYEAAGDHDDAREAYEAVAELYPDAPVAAAVPIYLARLDAMAVGE